MVRRALLAFSLIAAFTTILLHISYPLTDGNTQRLITIASVAVFFVSSLAHIAAHHGGRGVLALTGCGAAIGWAAEALGVATGFPFGTYAYADTLGWKLVDVVVIVPLAWAMMAWPALVAGRRTRHPVLVASAILVTWDLFLDPQMVDAGHWTWTPSRWPDLHGIPISNSFGWALTAAAVTTALHRLVPTIPEVDERVPFLMLAWTWFSSTLGFVVFFGRPTVSLVAGPALLAALWLPLQAVRADPPLWWPDRLRRPAATRPISASS
jgi:uncharacterized membrane protein